MSAQNIDSNHDGKFEVFFAWTIMIWFNVNHILRRVKCFWKIFEEKESIVIIIMAYTQNFIHRTTIKKQQQRHHHQQPPEAKKTSSLCAIKILERDEVWKEALSVH